MTAPQFKRRIQPARARLDELTPRARWVFELCEALRSDGVTWPPEVFVPIDAISAQTPGMIARHGGPELLRQFTSLGPLGMMRAMDPLVTMATWRMTQGIYRIDPAVYPEIVDTPLEGDLPADALQRLPEWCVFVETPGLRTLRADRLGEEIDVLGAWARQDIEPGTGRRLLVIVPLVPGDEGMHHQYLPLQGNLEENLQAIFNDWVAAGEEVPQDAYDAVLRVMRPVLNLLLYVASSNDISRRGMSTVPANPEPVRTRRHGWRLFPASGPTEWDVGVRMGAALRAAYQREQVGGEASPTGRQVRPHVRRAHWHTFLTGPRIKDGEPVPTDQRRRDLRWVPPIPVNVADLDAMPSVIRKVE